MSYNPISVKQNMDSIYKELFLAKKKEGIDWTIAFVNGAIMKLLLCN